MSEIDYIIDPPSSSRKMVIAMILTTCVGFILFTLWYFIFHADSSDHAGHFACHLLDDNPLLLAATMLAGLVLISGKDR